MVEKKKIILDIDDVVFFSGFLELVNEFLGTNYEIDEFTDYFIDKAAIPSNKMSEFNDFIDTKDQYENPVWLPGALEMVIKLSEYYDIFPCSDCRNPFDLERSGRLLINKYNLLYRNIPQNIIPTQNYIFTGAKNLFNADVQIDNLLSNLSGNIPVKIMFPAYHNKTITDLELKNQGAIRAGYEWRKGWEQVGKILLPNKATSSKQKILIIKNR